MKCRSCGFDQKEIFLDLGKQPPANNYLLNINELKKEFRIPLQLFFCKKCYLVQTKDYIKPEKLFSKDYAYLSSVSSSWVQHAKKLKQKLVSKFNLSKQDIILEIASNDGYLLDFFVKDGFKNCFGIEPTHIVAQIARKKKIDVVEDFFSLNLSYHLKIKGKIPRLIIANNVIAHVQDLNDFIAGIKNILAPDGFLSIEFAYLLELIKFKQFDTIYHEHYSYISLLALEKIFKKHGLRIFDIEKLKTHGGSLRVFGCHLNSDIREEKKVKSLVQEEINYRLDELEIYKNFSKDIKKIKDDFLEFISSAKKRNFKIVGYGAAAKGNTFLNYCGITSKDILFVVDNAFTKQNKFLPGSGIPIVDSSYISKIKPDYILILPWNLSKEISKSLKYTKKWNCKLIRAIPELDYI